MELMINIVYKTVWESIKRKVKKPQSLIVTVIRKGKNTSIKLHPKLITQKNAEASHLPKDQSGELLVFQEVRTRE